MATVYDFSARRLAGAEESLSAYRGQALLIVNVASQCGFTPQYAGLEALYRAHKTHGFQILGFPCNQFGAQEPGDANAIGSFCSQNYGVTFPIFEKIEVKGPGAHPLYQFLTSAKRGIFGTRDVKWNFTKFLVDRTGTVTGRFAPAKTPKSLEGVVKELL
jgi:glutathione peroxidase